MIQTSNGQKVGLEGRKHAMAEPLSHIDIVSDI